MQLSKLTFSLASLVLLMAFGLVFGTMPIMADDGAGGTTDDPHSKMATPPTRLTLMRRVILLTCIRQWLLH